MARRKPSVNLSRFSVDYILARREKLMNDAGDRNAQMERYEKMYRLDMWTSERASGEQRAALPIAADMVDKETALLLARPFQMSVPPANNGEVERYRAQKIERFLYGVADRTNMYYHANRAAWSANCRGRGWIKAVYDDQHAEDEFPVLVTTPDPKTIYYRYDSRSEEVVELVHTFERPRRDIENEYGVTLPDAPTDDTLDDWLDEPVIYTEFWSSEVVLEKPDEGDSDKQEEAPKGVIEMAAEHYMALTVAAKAPPVDLQGNPTPTLGDSLSMMPVDEGDDLGVETTPKTKRKKQRVRRIIHSIVVGDGDNATVVKKPVILPGYKHVPFFSWAGIETPMDGKESLSILYAASGGDAGDRADGVLQIYNTIVSLYLDESVKRSHAPVMTDDATSEIDLSPDTINVVKPGSNVSFLQPPPAPGGLLELTTVMGRMLDRVGPPEVWNGQAHNLSGQAISGLANAYQMRLALKQHTIEKALRKLCGHVLCLTAYYSDPDDGWRAYGTGAYGRNVDEAVTADDIGDQYRVTVKLSSSLPKDEIAQVSMFAQLLGANAISWETFLDQFQKMFGLAADSPEDEIERTFTYMLLRQPDFAKDIAQAKAQDFVELMRGLREGTSLRDMQRAENLRHMQPQAPPQPKPAPPILSGQPQQPNQPGEGDVAGQGSGLPPSAAPPTPDTLAANGALMAGMNMAERTRYQPGILPGMMG